MNPQLNGSLIRDSARAPIHKAAMRPVNQPSNISRGWLGADLLALTALVAHGFAL
jgi:hypothetical protein